MSDRWIDLAGAVNVRDLGGLPTVDGGSTRFGQVVRSDNLQGLTDSDVDHLTRALGVTDVVDLRTGVEVTSEGPGPLTRLPEVSIHHLSLFPEVGERTDLNAEVILPWSRDDESDGWVSSGLYYTNYLRDQPANVVTALRVMANSPGATIAHCAGGKDRTGVVCAMALSVAGVEREAIVADYAQTSERLEALLGRLMASSTYAADLRTRQSLGDHRPLPDSMWTFLGYLDETFGGPLGWLGQQGWTDTDTGALRARLTGS